MLIYGLPLGPTNQKNNIRVNTVTIASRIKTKPNVIKTRSICASTLGPAPRSTDSLTAPSMLQPAFRKPTTTKPNQGARLQISSWLLIHVATVANNFRTILLPIGTLVLHISQMCTNSASAINRRSSSAPTTSVSISSTAMPAPVGNGRTC